VFIELDQPCVGGLEGLAEQLSGGVEALLAMRSLPSVGGLCLSSWTSPV